MKHLVVDARGALPQVDGLGTYVRQIVPQLCSAGARGGGFRTTLLVHPELESFWHSAAPEAAVQPSMVRSTQVPQNWRIPLQVGPLKPDLFFYPGHDPPLLLRTPMLFTIHDLTLFQGPGYFERLDRLKRSYLNVITPVGLRRAKAVFTVSHYTRQVLGQIFGARFLSKVHVTPNGICAPRAASEAFAQRDCILYVGTDRPHKNLRRVIAAYALAKGEVPDLPRLEIVGGMRSPEELRRAIRKHAVEDHITLRGHVSELELEACYARAVMLVFPSVAEGFGLPILEAMVRAVPVITSDGSGCAEVAGNAALTIDPLDTRAIASAIVRLHGSPSLRAELVQRGLARAALYTWQRTAEQTLQVINDCLAKRPRRF